MAIDTARDAQRKFCQANDLPMFAPGNGACPFCGRDIYSGPYGYDEKRAGGTLITSCPYCHHSFVD